MPAAKNGSTKWVLGIAAILVASFVTGAVAWGYSVASNIATIKTEVIYLGKMQEPVIGSIELQRNGLRDHLIDPTIHGSGLTQLKTVLEETNKRLQRIESKIDSGN